MEQVFQLLCIIAVGFGTAALAAGYDAERHRDKPGLNHASRLAWRTVWMLVLYYAVGRFTWAAAEFGAVFTCAFYLAFDIVFNVLIGQKWYYMGSTAKTDQMLYKIGGRVITAIETAGLVGASTLYLL